MNTNYKVYFRTVNTRIIYENNTDIKMFHNFTFFLKLKMLGVSSGGFLDTIKGPRNNVRSKKNFLIVTKNPPDETPSIFNFKKGEIMKHPNRYTILYNLTAREMGRSNKTINVVTCKRE